MRHRLLSCPVDRGESYPRRSGCGVEGDGVAEGVELSDVVADLAFGVGAGGVVVRTEVDELGLIVGEQRPDDDQDRAADRDDRSFLAAAAGDPSVALAEEGVGAGGADCAASPTTRAR
jgi:hypothetical protein